LRHDIVYAAATPNNFFCVSLGHILTDIWPSCEWPWQQWPIS